MHVVMTGYDYTPFVEGAAPHTRLRLTNYCTALPEGSSLTYVAIGHVAAPIKQGTLTMMGIASTKQLSLTLSELKDVSIVATQTPYEEAVAALDYCRDRYIPLVVQVHSDPFYVAAGWRGRLVSWLRMVMLKQTVKKAALVRCVNPEIADNLRKMFPGKRVEFVPAPITLAPLAPAPATPPEILFVGQLAPEKDIPLWLKVAATIHAKRPDVRFHIVGPGETLSAPDYVTFHGGIPNDQLGAFYQRASIFLLTSKKGGRGHALIEAIAHGVPVVSTPTQMARTIIGEGPAGILAEGASALADSVLAYLNNQDKRKEASQAALALAQNYEPNALIQRWMGLLIDIAAQSAKEKTL